MSKKDQRLNETIKILKHNKKMDIKDLAETFNVTEMTIRRDLDILQSSNLVSNVHGTVFYREDTIINDDEHYLVVQQRGIMDDEKERIAKEASRLIEPGDSVIIDIGTTTSKVIGFLPKNYPISLVCFTANALFEAIKKNFELLFLGGGYYHPKSQMFESPDVDVMLGNQRASKVFVSAAGVNEKLGITCINEYEVATKAALMSYSKIRILLADSSKFGQVKNGYFASLHDIDMIITDTGISEEWISIIKNYGIELKIV